jgi:hypothetical protein
MTRPFGTICEPLDDFDLRQLVGYARFGFCKTVHLGSLSGECRVKFIDGIELVRRQAQTALTSPRFGNFK